MVAVGLGLLAIDEGYTVAFEKMESLVRVMDDAEVDRKAGFRLRYLRKCQMLIVDEIGYTPITKAQANRFFSLVSDAYERQSLVFTTNKEIPDWAEMVQDPVLATALMDRILHHARCFSLRGESYRLKHPELYAHRD
jgi:DNA replication protein DnaC